MKKIFTLLSLVMLMFAVNANAQDRKTWDFTKGVSDETRELLIADKTNWTSNGDPISSWTTNVKFTGELTAGDVVIKEFAGLKFGDFGATNALMYFGNKLRLQKAASIKLPVLKAGQQITIKAQSANSTATDRGFSITNACDAEGYSSFTLLGGKAEGAPDGGLYTIVVNVVSDGEVMISTGMSSDPKSGIEFLSFVIDEGDKNIKKWDFSAFSAATVEQVCGAADWTTAESASKNYITGNEIRWINEPKLDANGDLTAGNVAIKELMGLGHEGLAQYSLGLAFNYPQTLDGNNWGPYHGGSYIWVMGTATKIIVPNVKAGSELKLGVETHKLIPTGTSDARGFKLIVNGTEIAAQTTTDFAEKVYAIPAGDDEYVDVQIVATKGCHLYYIEAEVKDEAFVDKNIVLGNPSYSIAEGAKINTLAESLVITFPKKKNIEAGTEVTIEGTFASTGENGETVPVTLVGTIDGGVSLVFGEYLPLEENQSYKFSISSIEVTGYEELFTEASEGEELFPLTFVTAGPGIDTPREWQFTLTQETAEQIAQSIDAGNSKWSASSKGRYCVTSPFTNAPLTFEGTTPIPNTDGLLFSMSNGNDILLGTPKHTGVGGAANNGGNNGYIQLGGGSPELIIPECSKGDEVTIKAVYADKNKSCTITIVNGKCGESNEITLTGSDTDYTIVVENHGDLILKSKLAKYKSISIFPATMEKVNIQYTVNAATEDGTVLKKLAEGEGQTNDKVSVAFPFYLMDAEGNLYTKGVKGTAFQTSVVLETGVNDYPLTYKQTTLDGMTKAVFCSEAEELKGSVMECTPTNADIRASNQKVAYAVADVELCTLPAGTYKIKAMIWDAVKGGGSTVMKFKAGEQAIDMTSAGDNMSEVISEAFTLDADTKLVWEADANYAEGYALDAIVVFGYDETLSGITDITTAAKAKVAKKLENGQIIIIKDNVKYNAAGVQVK